MIIDRYLRPQVERDLERKMVLVAGPRQVGKTTMARRLPGGTEGYLNWDVPEHRERILRRELPRSPLLILDEIPTCLGRTGTMFACQQELAIFNIPLYVDILDL